MQRLKIGFFLTLSVANRIVDRVAASAIASSSMMSVLFNFT
ncbi:MAG: hypothetical protein ACK4QP_13825 [Pseudorhizobium sp.]